jgi:hypothetical protein
MKARRGSTRKFRRQPNLNWTNKADGVVVCVGMMMTGPANQKQK